MNRKETDTKSKVGVSIFNANSKKKPSGKPFEKGNKIGNRFKPGFDPNRNAHGQRNKEAVRLTTEMRNLYVEVLNEPFEEGSAITNLEYGVRRQVSEGAKYNNDAWEAALNRTWGRSTQVVETDNVVNPLADSVNEGDRDRRILEIFESAAKRRMSEDSHASGKGVSKQAATKSGKKQQKADG